MKQAAVTSEIGDARDYAKEPGKLEFPNLRITFSEIALPTWKVWFDDFVVSGNNDESKEKGGSLTFFSPNRRDQLFQIVFHNLGICSLEQDSSNPKDQVLRWVAELYCEQMEITRMGQGDAGATSSTTTEPARTDPPATPTKLRRADVGESVARTLPTRKTLDSALAGNRKFGSSPAFDVALRSMEYTVTRERVGSGSYPADAGSKLMLIEYTIHNPSASPLRLTRETLQFQVTDSAGVNRGVVDIAMGANNERIGGSVLPDQTMECRAIVPMPANVDASTLTMTCPEDGSIQKIDTAGKASLREAWVQDASAGDDARFTALSVVPSQAGVFYPMMKFDFRLDSIGYADRPKIGGAAPPKTKCLMANITIRNPSPENARYDGPTFRPALAISDGSNLQWNGYLLSVAQDVRASTELTPGQELKVRLFFDVPESEAVAPVGFRFSESKSRTYLFDLGQ